ncbi:dihydrofolate reductase family protein [Herbiconiux sp. L3-i23]|uniref:dihydrofolate reductase family protein n=1 Tax=Herbiconiux sp. L3-i23 TaxID=2905871 RepID=UPI002070D842|nr:dihydrofolate reductase family protein [Herbiconiux sp. L3-i23]BDI22900.1 deaminase reductase [Herbiconiux sp. L3-i23]
MATITAVENVSLDGVMQSPGRPDEDTRDGFDLGGWAMPFLAADPEAAAASMSGEGRTGGLLFGRRTYDDLVGYWLGTDQPNPFTEILRSTPKYVASRTPNRELPHPNSILLEGELTGAVRAVKESVDGDIVILGSGDVVRQLAAAGLIDSYTLTTLPVVLGKGQRLFDHSYAALEVERSITSKTGIVVASYRVVHA